MMQTNLLEALTISLVNSSAVIAYLPANLFLTKLNDGRELLLTSPVPLSSSLLTSLTVFERERERERERDKKEVTK